MTGYRIEERDASTGAVLHATNSGWDGPLTAEEAPSRFARELRAHPGRYALGSPYRLVLVGPKLSNNPDDAVPLCVRCQTTAAVGTCCSSHRKELCHRCYRLTHFVEVCGESCSACAAEGLPVRLSDSRRANPREVA